MGSGVLGVPVVNGSKERETDDAIDVNGLPGDSTIA